MTNPLFSHMRATVAALLIVVTMAGAAVAGPFEDGGAAFVRGDYATAMRLWRPLAEQGDALAQSNLGQMYSKGQGVPQDYAAADRQARTAKFSRSNHQPPAFVSPYIYGADKAGP